MPFHKKGHLQRIASCFQLTDRRDVQDTRVQLRCRVLHMRPLMLETKILSKLNIIMGGESICW